MKKTIFVILMVFLILPFFGQAQGIDGDINQGESEDPADDSEISRYLDSADKITQIVSNSVVTLPKLDMIGSEVINSVITKVNEYNSFVNDYTQDIETDGASLFDDLITGYRITRKVFYLVKDMDSLSLSIQTAYELVNTTEELLSGYTSKEISNYENLETALVKYKNNLDTNLSNIEFLILSMISNVQIDREFYVQDINNLTSLRGQLKEIVNDYLELSIEITDTSEEVVTTISEIKIK